MNDTERKPSAPCPACGSTTAEWYYLADGRTVDCADCNPDATECPECGLRSCRCDDGGYDE